MLMTLTTSKINSWVSETIGFPVCTIKHLGKERVEWEKAFLASWSYSCGSSVWCIRFSSVQFSPSVVSDSLQHSGLQHTRLPCPTPTPGVYSNMCLDLAMPSNHLILHRPLLLPLSTFPESGLFPISQFFTSGAKVLEFQLQYQSFKWISRTDFL